MSKAQVSLFIIIALALLILVGLLIALRGPSVKQPPTKDLSPQAKRVANFVEQCLLDSTMNGLRLLGEQGGVIYKSQGGFVPDSFADERFAWNHNGNWVWYSIRPDSVTYGKSCAANDLGVSYDYEACPSYTFPFYDEQSPRIAFGSDQSSKTAHDIYGNVVDNTRLLNRLSLPGLYERGGPQSQVAWIQPLLAPYMKIKPNLAEFIKNNISKCLNFSEFERAGLPVIPNQPISEANVNPLFSEAFTRIEFEWPLKIVDVASNTSTLLTKFNVNTQVRFGKIYKYVNDILKKEAEDYSFNLSKAEPDDGIRLEKLDSDSYKKKVDIVVFIDEESKINDKSATVSNYQFTGAIPNSPPAISYIHYRNLSAAGLLGFLRTYCGFDDTPYGLNVLAKQAFSHMNRDTIKCIFSAYANATKLQGTYRPAYDPDDDKLNWSFKTSDCDWNQDCEYDNESEFDHGMESQITLRFYEVGNSNYDDYFTIPLKLYNFAPNSLKVECVGAYYGNYMYSVSAINPETGSGQDELELLPPKVIGNTLSVESYELVDISGDWVTWHVKFENKTGNYQVKFTVEDSFGATNSTTVNIAIPCAP